MFIFTRILVTYARTIFKPRCCLNFRGMRTQAEFTYIAHNMFGQIKMEIPWYIIRHTLIIFRKRDGKSKWYAADLLLCELGSTNSASLQTPLILCFSQICSKLLHGNSMPSLNSSYINSHPRSLWKALSNWAVQQALERGCKLSSAWTTLRKVSLLVSILLKSLTADLKPVELQRFMSTFSEYSPISGRLLHT